MKKAEKVSCLDRAKQYGKGVLHASGNKLFCSTCNITLDHMRKGTIDRHLESSVHVTKRMKLEEIEQNKLKKQETISKLFTQQTKAKSARQIEIFEIVQAFTEANIFH